MDWLNYHHLLYFWTVAREGSITKACRQLHLAQPTVSSQLKQLEHAMGEKLFERVGRTLTLTETGQVVYRYADEIFSLGNELLDVVRGRPTGKPLRLAVGIPDALPKLVAYRLLKPALELPERVQLVCDEGTLEQLLGELGSHRLDLVLSDAPMGPEVNVRAFNHLLGECGVSIFGTAKLARRLRRNFPRSLDGAPFLMPSERTASLRSLEQWFDSQAVRPEIAGQFDDSGLLKVFGQAGVGVFAAPSAIEKETCRQYGVQVIGRPEGLTERFYAISVERRLKHPAVVAISKSARQELSRG